MIHLIFFNTGELSEAYMELESGPPDLRPAWSIDVILNGELIRTAWPLVLPVNLAEEQEFLWLLENYAENLFLGDREDKCMEIYKRYATTLYMLLGLDDILMGDKITALADEGPQTLLVEVVETTDKAVDNPIHRIFWELLVRLPIVTGPRFKSSSALVLRKVVVTRSFSSASCVVDRTPFTKREIVLKPAINTKQQTFNVLLVIARDPDLKKSEADSNLALFPLLCVQKSSGGAISVEVVRPGTFAAVRKHLKAGTQEHGKGYYHLVHFDVHGQVRLKTKSNENCSREFTAGLLFSPRTYATQAMDLVPAGKIATLLHDHGIELVVLNACRSANSRNGDSANLAKALLDKGIRNVIAMQCKIINSAVLFFCRFFYQKFLQERLPLSKAVSEAQLLLSQSGERPVSYGPPAYVQDWIIPVVYMKDSDTKITGECYQDPDPPVAKRSTNSFIPQRDDQEQMIRGRDRDRLAVERDLIEFGLVFLHGVGGIGKTAFLSHMTSIWKATKFTKRVIYIDFASAPPVNHCTFIERLRSQIDPKSVTQTEKHGNWFSIYRDTEYSQYSAADIDKLLDDLHNESTVLILDSLDLPLSLNFRSRLSEKQQEQLISLISRIIDYTPKGSQVKPRCIFVSRNDQSWWNRHFTNRAARYLHLQALDSMSTLHLAYEILEKSGYDDPSSMNFEESDSLECILANLDNNPLAMELVLPLYKSMGGLKKLLDSLFYGPLDYYQIRTIRPTLLGGNRIFRELDQLITSIGEMWRFYMRCLAFFWLEGPSSVTFIAILQHLKIPTEPFDTERGCSVFFGILYELGACELPSTTKMPIQNLHPVFSLFLRCWHNQYNPGELEVNFFELLDIFRFSLETSFTGLVTKSCFGQFTLGTLYTRVVRWGINVRNAMKLYSQVPYPFEEWPMVSITNFLQVAGREFSGNMRKQTRLATDIKQLLDMYIRLFGDSQKILKPEHLSFALHISNHLFTIYLHDLGILPKPALDQLDFSLGLIEASEATYGMSTLPKNLGAKAITFQHKAKICLEGRKFDEAENYWKLQTEMERKAIEQLDFDQSFPGVRDYPTALVDAQQYWIRSSARMEEGVKKHQADWDDLLNSARQSAAADPLWNDSTQQLDPDILDIQVKAELNSQMDGLRSNSSSEDADRLTRSLTGAFEKDDSRDLLASHMFLYSHAMKEGNLNAAELHARAALIQMHAMDATSNEVSALLTQCLRGLEVVKQMSPESQEEYRTKMKVALSAFTKFVPSHLHQLWR